MSSYNKTSLLIPSQLPEFIRDNPDYGNFVLFLQAYYEWLEQNNNTLDYSKNLLSYSDVDSTTNDFLNYFYNNFLSYFPQSYLTDVTKNKTLLLKIAEQLYQSKGTSDSYKFLFRVIFNSDVDLFLTKDAVLKASDGQWYVAKYLNLNTTNPNFLSITNVNGSFRIFGETTKSIADIENVVFTGTRTQVYISNIQRQFQSGEYVKVIDSNNQDVYFLNGSRVSSNTVGAFLLRSKVVGQVDAVNIDKINGGLLYQPGDPVVFYGGLANPLTDQGASAVVSQTTTGSLQSLTVNNGGYGYTQSPNTLINFSITGITAPTANIPSYGLNTAQPANVAYLPSDTIGSIAANNIYIGNTAFSSGARPKGNSVYYFANNQVANANTTLANAFTFVSFTTYPIVVVNTLTPGSGITSINSVTAQSLYPTSNNLSSNTVYLDLKTAGILAPIQIISPGQGYTNNDTVLIIGGTGSGAYANVTVNSTNAIVSVNYVFNSNDKNNIHGYPLGGFGYSKLSLPSVNVVSTNAQATGASLIVPGILGDGATFNYNTNYVGQISSIQVTNPGQDYVSAANVTLKVQDIVISNVSSTLLPAKGDTVYQGSSFISSTYYATVDSVYSIGTNIVLRVYNYSSIPSSSVSLGILNKNIYPTVVSSYNSGRFVNVILTYGDGTAQATVTFTNGLSSLPGKYISSRGQLSSYSLLESDTYNNFTYELTAKKEIEKYRKILLDLVHPSGLKVLGRYSLSSNTNTNYNLQDALYQAKTLYYYTGLLGAQVVIYPDPNFVNPSNNIINFQFIGNGTNIGTFIFANSSLNFYTSNNDPVAINGISSINYQSNTITSVNNVWTTFDNVATISANSGSNAINIRTITSSYGAISGGVYSNTSYPLKDIVRAGDTIRIRSDSNTNPSQTVTRVDYLNNIVYVGSNFANTITGSNSYMSVNRTYISNTSAYVKIYGPTGLTYIPYFVTQDEQFIVTESNNFILIG